MRLIHEKTGRKSRATAPLTLIGPGEVKVDLANFDLKLHEDL